jgi:hypothetical protein
MSFYFVSHMVWKKPKSDAVEIDIISAPIACKADCDAILASLHIQLPSIERRMDGYKFVKSIHHIRNTITGEEIEAPYATA